MNEKKRRRNRGEEGQSLIIVAIGMIALLAIVALALDGAMIFWNQRRAQNGADAAVIAGTTALINQSLVGTDIVCGGVEQPILDQVYQYASNNEVPDADIGENVKAYYLTEDDDGNLTDLINPDTSDPWEVVGGATEIPCGSNEIAGLHVETSFPQTTFIAGLIGIAETNVTTHAYAIWEYRFWCTDFAVFGINTDRNKDVVSVIGAGTHITNGGVHSNGGIHIGGGGQDIYLEDGRPVEFDTDGDSQIGCDKIIGGPVPEPPYPPDSLCHGITQVDNYPLPDGFAYRFEDFAPGGYIWDEMDPSERFYCDGDVYCASPDIGNDDVKNPDGSLKDGLYVAEGDIKLNNLNNLGPTDPPWRATFVARGQIQISGGINQLPIAYGIFVFSLSDNTSVGAVKLSGSSNSWAGLVLAPNGNFDMSGARNSDLAGMILANEVNISGSDNRINHHPEYCPRNPPRVLLTK